MKKTLFFCSALALLLMACKQDPKNAGGQSGTGNSQYANPTILAGHWVNIDFCSRSNQYGSVLDAMTNAHLPYAYAFSFDPNKPDSVTCFNGMEEWALPVKFKDDTLELVGATANKSVFLVYHSGSTKEISMYDGTKGPVRLDRFIKSNANARDGYTAFAAALNHNLFSGSFSRASKGLGKENIVFSPGGFILNWDQYNRYQVCTNGDCFVMGNDMDVITLSNSKKENSTMMYGFKYSAANDTLTLYNLINTNPDEKGAYKLGKPAFTLLRKPAE